MSLVPRIPVRRYDASVSIQPNKWGSAIMKIVQLVSVLRARMRSP